MHIPVYINSMSDILDPMLVLPLTRYSECAAECEKTVAYYQSRKAKLKKEYNKSCAELEREYKDAVDELNRSLGVSTPASREPEHTAQEDTGAGNADEGEELTQNEKFLKKAGYSETGAKGEVCVKLRVMYLCMYKCFVVFCLFFSCVCMDMWRYVVKTCFRASHVEICVCARVSAL